MLVKMYSYASELTVREVFGVRDCLFCFRVLHKQLLKLLQLRRTGQKRTNQVKILTRTRIFPRNSYNTIKFVSSLESLSLPPRERERERERLEASLLSLLLEMRSTITILNNITAFLQHDKSNNLFVCYNLITACRKLLANTFCCYM